MLPSSLGGGAVCDSLSAVSVPTVNACQGHLPPVPAAARQGPHSSAVQAPVAERGCLSVDGRVMDPVFGREEFRIRVEWAWVRFGQAGRTGHPAISIEVLGQKDRVVVDAGGKSMSAGLSSVQNAQVS